MRFVIFALTIALLGGCRFKKMEEIAVCPDCSLEEQEQIIEAVDAWFEASPGSEIPVFIGESRGRGSIEIADDMDEDPCVKSPADTLLSPWRAPVIRICRRSLKGRTFKFSVLHELGHALGRNDEHLPDGEGVMAEDPPDDQELTDADVQFVLRKMPKQ